MAQGISGLATQVYFDDLAAQEEAARLQAEQQAAQLQAQQQAAAAAAAIQASVAAASTAPSATATPAAPTAAPTGDVFDDSTFARTYLPSQDMFKWVRTKQDFIDLPVEQRARLVDQNLQQRRIAEKWSDAEYLASKDSIHKKLTYMDTGGVAPKAEWLDNDIWDKSSASLRGLTFDVRRAFSDAKGIAALDTAEAAYKKADVTERFSANTNDVDRRAAFREREAAQLGNAHPLGAKLAGGFSDILAAPGAAAGTILGAALPTIAAAAATGGTSLLAQTAVLGGIAAAQSAVQSPSARYQAYIALGPEAFKSDPNYKTMKATGADDAQAVSFAAAKLAYGAGSTIVDAAIGGTVGAVGARFGGAALLQGRGAIGKAALVDQASNAVQTGATSLQGSLMGQSVKPVSLGDAAMTALGEVAGGVAPTLLGTAGFKTGSVLANAASKLRTPRVVAEPAVVNEQVVRQGIADPASPEGRAYLEAVMELPAKRTAEQAALVEAGKRVASGDTVSVDPTVITKVDPSEVPLAPKPIAAVAQTATAPTPDVEVARLSARTPAENAAAMADAFTPTGKLKPGELPAKFWTAQDVLAYADKSTPPEAIAQVKAAFQADLSDPIHTNGISAANAEALGVRFVKDLPSPVASLLSDIDVRMSIKNNINAIMYEGQSQNVEGTTVPRIKTNGAEVVFNFKDNPSLRFPDQNAAIQALATDPRLESFLPPAVYTAQAEQAQKKLERAQKYDAALEKSGQLVDTYFATDKSRPNDGTIGSAYLMPDGTVNAVYTAHDGTFIPVAGLPSMAVAKEWLQSKGTSVVVDREQKGSGQAGNINPAAQVVSEIVTRSQAVVPGTTAMVGMAKIAGATDVGAAVFAQRVLTPFRKLLSPMTYRDLYAEYGSRSAPTDILKKAALAAGMPELARTVGEDVTIRRKSAAGGELHTSGMTEKNIHDIKNEVAAATMTMSKGGVGQHIIENLLYARTAKERNAMVADKYPTDLRGEITDGNGSGFAYYEDKATGRLLDIQAGHVDAGRVAPENAVRMDGKDAAADYIVKFATQFPQHVNTAVSLADAIVRGNQRVLFLEQSAGRKSAADVARDSIHSHYMPLVQPDASNTNGTRAATGRSTATADVLQQWLGQLDRRTTQAYRQSAIRDMALFAQQLPMPDLMTLNSYDAKLKPSTDVVGGDTPRTSNIDWASDHGLGKDNTYRTYIGEKLYTITINDPVIASNMKTPEYSQVTHDYIIPILSGLNRINSLTRTTLAPTQYFVGAAWDSSLALANLQGGVGKNVATGDWVVPTSKVVGVWKNVMAGAVTDIGAVTQNEFRKTAGGTDAGATTADNVVQRWFAQEGGGINLHAATGVDMGSVNPVTGKPNALMRAGASLNHTVDTVATVGHVIPSAIRFNVFKEIIKLHNDGVLPQTPAEIQAFKAKPGNEYIVDAAVRGSKEVLGNFEAMGHSILVRSLFPFFNASMVGAFRVMPQLITSPAGLTSVATLMGLAAVTAAMQIGKDKDVDGYDQYTRKAGVWDNGLAIGGATIPLPHEMRVFANMATYAVAQTYGVVNPGSIDKAHINAKMLRTFVDLLPGLKTAPFDNAPLTSALGHLGFPIATAFNTDAMGKEFGGYKSNGTYDYNPAQQKFTQVGATTIAPDWTKYNSSNSNFQVASAKMLNANTAAAVDITPDAVQNLQRYLFGTWYRYQDTYEKGLLDSGGDHSVAARELTAAIFKPFWNEVNKNAVRDTYEQRVRVQEQKTYQATLDAALASRKTATSTMVADAGKQISGLRSTQGQSRAELDRFMSMYKEKGDMLGYAAAKKQVLEIDAQANIIRARTTNMLGQ